MFGGVGGRLDHTFAAINMLFRAAGDGRLVLIGNGHFVELLQPGRHVLRPNREWEGQCSVPLARW